MCPLPIRVRGIHVVYMLFLISIKKIILFRLFLISQNFQCPSASQILVPCYNRLHFVMSSLDILKKKKKFFWVCLAVSGTGQFPPIFRPLISLFITYLKMVFLTKQIEHTPRQLGSKTSSATTSEEAVPYPTPLPLRCFVVNRNRHSRQTESFPT